MPSRKRAQGKARKEKAQQQQKARKAVLDILESCASMTNCELKAELTELGGDPSLYLERKDLLKAVRLARNQLMLSTGLAGTLRVGECVHGYCYLSADCEQAFDAYRDEIRKRISEWGIIERGGIGTETFAVMVMATTRSNSALFPAVWRDATKRGSLRCMLVSLGTNGLLDLGDKADDADLIHLCFRYCVIILILENYDKWRELDGTLDKQQHDGGGVEAAFMLRVADRVRETYAGGRRSVVKFFSRRTVCSYLDNMYACLRSQQAKGLTCYHCGSFTPIDNLKECKQCELAVYCSKGCQKAHWPRHKLVCKWIPDVQKVTLNKPIKSLCFSKESEQHLDRLFGGRL